MYKVSRIVVLAIFLLSISITACAKVYLVSVGISDYPGTQNDLPLPMEDAKTVTWLYTQNADVEYRQLLNGQATRSNIISAMNTIFAKAKGDDVVVFFFSGHGYRGGFVAYDGYLDYAEIRKAMSKNSSKNKMIFADACFSGKIATPKKSQGNDLATAKKANVMLFLSSRSNETSIERRTMKNGIFTTYLIKALRGAADTNRDRIITAKELFKYVQRNVKKETSNRQHPVMWGKFPDNMKVMEW